MHHKINCKCCFKYKSKSIKGKILVLVSVVVPSLQAFFEECVFFRDTPLFVFGVSAV